MDRVDGEIFTPHSTKRKDWSPCSFDAMQTLQNKNRKLFSLISRLIPHKGFLWLHYPNFPNKLTDPQFKNPFRADMELAVGWCGTRKFAFVEKNKLL